MRAVVVAGLVAGLLSATATLAAPATPASEQVARDPALEELALALEGSGRAALAAAAFLEELGRLGRAGEREYFAAQAMLRRPRAEGDWQSVTGARALLAASLGKVEASAAQLRALVPPTLDRSEEARLVGLPLAARLAHSQLLASLLARALDLSDRELAAAMGGDPEAIALARDELLAAQLELVEAREAFAVDEASARPETSAERLGREAYALVFRANHLLLRIQYSADGGVIAVQPWMVEELRALALDARLAARAGREALEREAIERAAGRADADPDGFPALARLDELHDTFAREDAAAIGEAETIAGWAEGLVRLAGPGQIGAEAMGLSAQQVFAAEGRVIASNARMAALLADLGRAQIDAAEALERGPAR